MDKFNDIWKNSFNDGDMPVDDWNTPDAEVWSNILPHVPKKRKRSGLWWWLALTLLILMAISYFSFINVGQEFSSNSMNDEMAVESSSLFVNLQKDRNTDNISPKAKIKDRKNSTQYNTSIVSPRINNKETSSINNTVKSTTSARKAKEHLQINTGTVKVENNSDNTNPASTEVLETVFEKNTLPGQTSDIVIEDEVVDRLNYPIVFLPTRNVMLSNEIELPNITSMTGLKINKVKSPNLVSVGGRVGASFWQHKVSSQYQSDLEPFDFNYSNNTGWFAAVEVQIPINKYIELYSGLQYERVQTRSGHNSALTYEVIGEEGERTNEYALDLATPYGASAANFKFSRDESFSDATANLLVDFNSGHTIQNLSVPVGLTVFPLGKQKDWMPFASVGFGTNYLMNISNDIRSIDTNHDAITYTKTGTSTFQTTDINEWHFDLRIGLGLRYRITNSIQVDLNLNYSQGLNPIFEKENYNTKINRYNVSLGVIKGLSK